MIIKKIRAKAFFALLLVICITAAPISAKADCERVDSYTVASRFFELFRGCEKSEEKKEIYLCPGGEVFGVKIFGGCVSVAKNALTEASTALRENDVIKSINGKAVASIEDVKEILGASGGSTLSLSVLRKGRLLTLNITPNLIGNEYHLGVVLKDTTTGIGTVTYYDPETQGFGGLGHGVLDSDSKEIINMSRGSAMGVILAGASRGNSGSPGELRGVLTDKTVGTLDANTECGIFGTLCAPISNTVNEPIAIGKRSEITEGEATVITTVKNGGKRSFSIELFDVDYSSQGTKSFKVRVTDDALITITGGIVRGMSGSPIIQNGKLVGAVTHVMVNDPTTGYGIFIENMLNAAQMPMAKAS